MAYYIKCPFYIKHKGRNLSCEGCSKYFADEEKLRERVANLCEDKYTNCSYYKRLTALYNADPEVNNECLYKFYWEENKKQVKYLKDILTKTNKNVAQNIAQKQKEIHQAQLKANQECIRNEVLLRTVGILMQQLDMEEINFGKLISEAEKKYRYRFDVGENDNAVLTIEELTHEES